MIAIIDYGSGNLDAISNIYKKLKVPHMIACSSLDLQGADRYILPGVGAFDRTMDSLRRSGLADALSEQVIQNRKKILGICVGMQVLADSSEEGHLSGLGWIPGRVKKIDRSSLGSLPGIPHMGWNTISPKINAKLFESVDCDRGFYFLHSYHFSPEKESDIAATVHYGEPLVCAVARDNIFGVQFHPEKSHQNGISVFRAFSEI